MFICYHDRALAGKICLVTGASRGIGKGIALQLGEAGATVYITGNFKKLSECGNYMSHVTLRLYSVY